MAAEEGNHPWPGERNALQVPFEVANQPAERNPVPLGDLACRIARYLLRDVDWRIGGQRAGPLHRVEKHSCLNGRARAELDERGRTSGGLHDVGRIGLENRALGAGRVYSGSFVISSKSSDPRSS